MSRSDKLPSGVREIPSDAPAQPAAAVRLRPDFASDDARKQAALCFAGGWGYVRTAKLLGLSVNTVRDWSREYKKGKFNLKMSVCVYDDAFKKEVAAMRLAGRSWREIKEATGISPSTVMRWLKSRPPLDGSRH